MLDSRKQRMATPGHLEGSLVQWVGCTVGGAATISLEKERKGSGMAGPKPLISAEVYSRKAFFSNSSVALKILMVGKKNSKSIVV